MEEQITEAYGEESPYQLLNILICLFPKETFNFIETIYPFIYKFYNDTYSFIYKICDESSNKTSPDYYIITNKQTYFVEETECNFNESGNNAQYQRASKFVPKIGSSDKLIYIMVGDCSVKLSGNNLLSLRLWKTTNVNIVFTNDITMNKYNSLKSFVDLNELIQYFNDSCKFNKKIINYDEENNIIRLDINIGKTKFNLMKKGKPLDSDPNKGCLSLVLLAMYELIKLNDKQPKIIINNLFDNQMQIHTISTGNKMIRIFKHLIEKGVQINFEFEKDIIFDINNYNGYQDNNPFKVSGSNSEKIIGIYHITTKMKENEKCIFENHARTRNSKIVKNDGTIVDFIKMSKKPDIIIKNMKTYNVTIIESELYKNIKIGQKQINEWTKHKDTYNFYNEVCEYKNMEIYLELYDSNNEFNGDFSDNKFKNIKYIFNKNGQWFENKEHFQPLYFIV